jgi:hypothetical protein
MPGWFLLSLAAQAGPPALPPIDAPTILAADARGELVAQQPPVGVRAALDRLERQLALEKRQTDAETATLKLLESFLAEKGAAGLVMQPWDTGTRVSVLGRRRETWFAIAACQVPAGGAPDCTRAESPLDPEAQARAEAVGAAFAHKAPGSYPRLRPIILVPEDTGGSPGEIDVVLVPAPGGERVLGGDATYTWDRAAREITAVTLGKQAQVLPPARPDTQLGIVWEQSNQDVPGLPEVVTSRENAMRFFVVTRWGLWALDHGAVSYLGIPPAPDR